MPNDAARSEVEELSRKFHAIYQAEAKRQAGVGDDSVRHPDDYDALPEHTKEYDRVLARWVIEYVAASHAQGYRDGIAQGREDCSCERRKLMEEAEIIWNKPHDGWVVVGLDTHLVYCPWCGGKLPAAIREGGK